MPKGQPIHSAGDLRPPDPVSDAEAPRRAAWRGDGGVRAAPRSGGGSRLLGHTHLETTQLYAQIRPAAQLGGPNGPPSLVAGLITFVFVGEARAA